MTLTLKCEHLELRGLVNKVSPKGNTYYVAHVENTNGEAHQISFFDASGFSQGLKKGDKVCVTFEVDYRRYLNDNPYFKALSMEKEG